MIVATGSEPLHPSFFDFSQPAVMDSTELLTIERIPSSLLILGGGPIGCEFACLFAELGTAVTIVELLPQLLPQEDARAAKQFQSALRKKGIEVLVKTRLESVAEYRPDQVTVSLEGAARSPPRRCWWQWDGSRIRRGSAWRQWVWL